MKIVNAICGKHFTTVVVEIKHWR